jgi:hypothetical protein
MDFIVAEEESQHRAGNNFLLRLFQKATVAFKNGLNSSVRKIPCIYW